ncbi:uncharacterized protein V6R79_017517 [Siganus canaliculatus]
MLRPGPGSRCSDLDKGTREQTLRPGHREQTLRPGPRDQGPDAQTWTREQTLRPGPRDQILRHATRDQTLRPGHRDQTLRPGHRDQTHRPGHRDQRLRPGHRDQRLRPGPGTRRSDLDQGPDTQTWTRDQTLRPGPGTRRSDLDLGTRRSDLDMGNRRSDLDPGTRRSDLDQGPDAQTLHAGTSHYLTWSHQIPLCGCGLYSGVPDRFPPSGLDSDSGLSISDWKNIKNQGGHGPTEAGARPAIPEQVLQDRTTLLLPTFPSPHPPPALHHSSTIWGFQRLRLVNGLQDRNLEVEDTTSEKDRNKDQNRKKHVQAFHLLWTGNQPVAKNKTGDTNSESKKSIMCSPGFYGRAVPCKSCFTTVCKYSQQQTQN